MSTVTLASATLTYGIDSQSAEVVLSDVSGVLPGYQLYIDRELFQAKSVSGQTVQVKRGIGGTAQVSHSSSAGVWIGAPDSFYQQDPVGSPPEALAVSPWINVPAGRVWMAQGDALPNGVTNRWWQLVVPTYGYGSLGVRTQTSTPTSST